MRTVAFLAGLVLLSFVVVNLGWIGNALGVIAAVELSLWYGRQPLVSPGIVAVWVLAVVVSYGLTFLHPLWEEHQDTAAFITLLIAIACVAMWALHRRNVSRVRPS